MASRSRADPADGVAALDGLSEQLLAAAPGLRVEVARTDAERRAAFRLRHDQVMGDGWAEAADGGLEQDAFDAAALHICAWGADELIGTVRVILPVEARPLPVEAAFGLTVDPRGEVVEVGRLVIARGARGDPAHAAWGALFARAWLELRARGYAVLAGAATPRMVERLRGLGLPFETLAPARRYWGEPRHPVRLDPAQGHPRWF